MKKLFLLLLLCLLANSTTFAQEKRVTLTVTVGVPFTINPVSDAGFTPEDLDSHQYFNPETNKLSTTYYLSNNTACTVTYSENKIPLNYVTSSSGYYYIYTLTATKTGTFTFVDGYYGKVGASWTTITMIYTINAVTVTSISIPSTKVMNVGDKYTFSPTISHPSAKTTLTWTSSNTSVATINAKGVLSAKSVGTTTITCTAHNGVKAQCVVTVNPIIAKSISLNKSEYELVKGETTQLSATISPTNTTNPAVRWTSSNENIATVDANGKVEAISAGVCNITATTVDGSNLSASCRINIPGNVLFTNNAVGVPSGTFILPIQLNNTSAITGLQFELQLPEGVSVAQNAGGNLVATLSDRVVDHTITGAKRANGNYQFIVFSGTSAAMTGNEGTIAYITLNVGANVPIGQYTISVKEVELTNTNSESLHHKDLTSKLTLTEAVLGDINGDSKVTVTDAVAIVNYILERAPSVFISLAADVNGDGFITITDAVSIINQILNK